MKELAKLFTIFLILTFLVFQGTGCSKKESSKQEDTNITASPPKTESKEIKGEATPEKQGQLQITEKEKGQVLAKVNNDVITIQSFKEKLEKIPPYYRARYASEQGKKDLLDEMITQTLLYQEGQKKELDKDPEIVERLSTMKEKLITEKLIKDVVQKDIEVSDKEVEDYYNNNKDEFTVKEKVKASMILIKVAENATPEEDTQAKKKAEEIVEKLKNGEDFAKLAEAESQDPTGKRGGDLRWFSKGRYTAKYGENFDEIAFSLKEGDISEPFKTKEGYCILKITGKKPEEIRSLDSVKESLKRKLQQKAKREALEAYKEKLKQTSNITIDEEALKDIPVEVPQEATPPVMPPTMPVPVEEDEQP